MPVSLRYPEAQDSSANLGRRLKFLSVSHREQGGQARSVSSNAMNAPAYWRDVIFNVPGGRMGDHVWDISRARRVTLTLSGRCLPAGAVRAIHTTAGPPSSGYLPEPVRVVTVGLLEALLVSVSVPVYVCLSTHRKVT